ncbi:MAG: hypothetical protein ABI411_21500 [Tahibacter sp.]
MDGQTIWRVVRHPVQHLQLWAISTDEPFTCRIWHINNAQCREWQRWREAFAIDPSSPPPDFLNQPYAQRIAASVQIAFDFFATDFSVVLRGHAENMFHHIDPQQFQSGSPSPDGCNDS